MKLDIEQVAVFLKILREEKLNHQDKKIINELLQKSEAENLAPEMYLEFVKEFFRLTPLLKILYEHWQSH